MTILYALLTFVLYALTIYLITLFINWNHNRRLNNKMDWIYFLYDSLENKSFIYKNKEFDVRVERKELSHEFDDNEDTTFTSYCYKVYINNVLVIVMNVIETCGPSYRFIKYPSEYDSTEIEKIIKRAVKAYFKQHSSQNNTTIKSFLK